MPRRPVEDTPTASRLLQYATGHVLPNEAHSQGEPLSGPVATNGKRAATGPPHLTPKEWGRKWGGIMHELALQRRKGLT